MSHDEFINIIKKAVYENCLDRRIIPSIIISHAIIASDWGVSELAIRANNIFGTKCNPDLVSTCYRIREHVQSATGKTYDMQDVTYRMYPSWRDSVLDYITRIEMKDSFLKVGSYRSLDKNVQEYATVVSLRNEAINYTKLSNMIQEYELDQYDDFKKNHNPYVLAQIGDRGEMVKWIQYELSVQGYRSRSHFEDGFFDYDLMVTLQRYQSDHDMEPSGFVDLKTFKTLSSSRLS